MQYDLSLSVAGLAVGLLVGLTGMGGGALLTPLLMLVFRVAPLTAVSSDLLTSLLMKPVGAAVHVRRRTVHWRLVRLLTVGSVPAAFAGAVLAGTIGHGADAEEWLKLAIGIALCVSVAATVLRQLLDRRDRRLGLRDGVADALPLVVHPLGAVIIGLVSGFAVGVTSVGAGSLVIAMLLIAYPQLKPSQLVGTDIVQAIPLVAGATVGHLLFGDVQFGLTRALLLGALPAVYVGARLSADGPAAVVRPLVTAVLLASALALLKANATGVIGGAVAGLVVIVLLQYAPVRRRHRFGLPRKWSVSRDEFPT